jgi:hypothetical protein
MAGNGSRLADADECAVTRAQAMTDAVADGLLWCYLIAQVAFFAYVLSRSG